MNRENFERGRIAFESDQAIKRMALAEQVRRAAAAERAEAREVERHTQAERMLELLERGDLRAAERDELAKLLAGVRAPDHVPDFETVPPSEQEDD